LATALGVAGVPVVRQKYQVWACQNNLRQFHQALTSYSDWHGGHYPKVQDQPPYNTADSFVVMLRQAGLLAADQRPACPAQADPGPVQPYAYSLGYRDGERLLGLRYDEEQRDYLPILADRPSLLGGADSRGNSPDHRTGQNVLYLNGAVRYCTDPLAGVDRDYIYLNRNGLVSAGINRIDTVLGVGGDTP
jgi:hypothetical protein